MSSEFKFFESISWRLNSIYLMCLDIQYFASHEIYRIQTPKFSVVKTKRKVKKHQISTKNQLQVDPQIGMPLDMHGLVDLTLFKF